MQIEISQKSRQNEMLIWISVPSKSIPTDCSQHEFIYLDSDVINIAARIAKIKKNIVLMREGVVPFKQSLQNLCRQCSIHSI